jgi:hypothetical protein
MLCYPVSSQVSDEIDDLAGRFATSGPVRHVVIDDFLEKSYADEFFKDLPDLTAMPKSRDYMFSDKRELSTLDSTQTYRESCMRSS